MRLTDPPLILLSIEPDGPGAALPNQFKRQTGQRFALLLPGSQQQQHVDEADPQRTSERCGESTGGGTSG